MFLSTVLPRRARLHWATELARHRIKRTSEFAVREIGLRLEIKPNDVVIDCGANVGDVTSKLARTGATVYAFEPNPACFAILRKRFSVCRKVHCINAGVADCAGSMTLRVPGPHAQYDALDASVAGSFERSSWENECYRLDEVDIECVDLSDFISQFRRVRFLKLDIEGSEIAVLNRLIDTHRVDQVDLVAVETHDHLIDHLRVPTALLRDRIAKERLGEKVRLDWP